MSTRADATMHELALPWYRHRWPWLLIAGPAIVVVAGFYTAWLAARSDDGLVAEDYYKRGLLINRQLEKTARGAGIVATVDTRADGRLVVTFATDGRPADMPGRLRLRFTHPTRAGLDRILALHAAGNDEYLSDEPAPGSGRWILRMESDDWQLPSDETTMPLAGFRLGASPQAPAKRPDVRAASVMEDGGKVPGGRSAPDSTVNSRASTSGRGN